MAIIIQMFMKGKWVDVGPNLKEGSWTLGKQLESSFAGIHGPAHGQLLFNNVDNRMRESDIETRSRIPVRIWRNSTRLFTGWSTGFAYRDSKREHYASTNLLGPLLYLGKFHRKVSIIPSPGILPVDEIFKKVIDNVDPNGVVAKLAPSGNRTKIYMSRLGELTSTKQGIDLFEILRLLAIIDFSHIYETPDGVIFFPPRIRRRSRPIGTHQFDLSGALEIQTSIPENGIVNAVNAYYAPAGEIKKIDFLFNLPATLTVPANGRNSMVQPIDSSDQKRQLYMQGWEPLESPRDYVYDGDIEPHFHENYLQIDFTNTTNADKQATFNGAYGRPFRLDNHTFNVQVRDANSIRRYGLKPFELPPKLMSDYAEAREIANEMVELFHDDVGQIEFRGIIDDSTDSMRPSGLAINGDDLYWIEEVQHTLGEDRLHRYVAKGTSAVEIDMPSVGTIPGQLEVTFVPNNNRVEMEWNVLEGGPIKQFRMNAKLTSSDWGDDIVRLNVGQMKFTITGLQDGFEYDVRIAGENDEGVGPYTSARVTPRQRIPGPVTDLVLTQVPFGIVANWGVPNSGDAPTHYESQWYRGTGPPTGDDWQFQATHTELTRRLSASEFDRYWFRVRAVNAFGESGWFQDSVLLGISFQVGSGLRTEGLILPVGTDKFVTED